jgi:hypothetical protein
MRSLREKMAIEVPAQLGALVAEMAIELDDGTTLEATHDSGIPWADCRQAAPGARDQVRKPGDAGVGPAGTRRLHDAIERIDTLTDVGELARAAAKG